MNNKIRLFRIYLPFFIILTIGAVTLKTVAIINSFDFANHFFESNVLPSIANVLIAAAIFFFIIIISTCVRNNIKLIPIFSSPANYIPSAVISAALVFLGIRLFKNFIYSETLLTKWLSLILVIFALLSIGYFILNTIFIRTVSARRANFGLFTVIFLALYLAHLYFDTAAPINSPIKISDQLAYAFAAAFFLYEIRLSLGREKWKLYIIFAFITAILTAYSSIPALITYFVRGEEISNSIYESLLTLSICLFSLLKLLMTYYLTERKEASFVQNLKAASIRREIQLSHTLEEFHVNETLHEAESEIIDEPLENQLSILDIKPTEVEEEEETKEDTLDSITNESELPIDTPPMNISSEDYH